MTAYAAALEPAQAEAYVSAQKQFNAIITQLRSQQAQLLTPSQLEQFLDTDGRELLRLMLQAHLDERDPGAVSEPVVDATGHSHTHQRLQARSLKTIFGAVSVSRQGDGGRALESLHPLDAELNLPPENSSHTLQQRLSEAAAKESFAEVVATIHQQTGVIIPRRQAEESVSRAAQDFEWFSAEQRAQTAPEVKATSAILVISADGKGARAAQGRSPRSDSPSRRRTTAARSSSPQSRRKGSPQTDGNRRRGLSHRALCPHAGPARARTRAGSRHDARAPAPGRQARLGEPRTSARNDHRAGL